MTRRQEVEAILDEYDSMCVENDAAHEAAMDDEHADLERTHKVARDEIIDKLVRRIEAQIDECGPDSNDGDDFYAIEGDTLLRVLSDTRTALLRAGPAVATPPDALRAAFDAGARWGFQMWAFPMTGAQIEAEAARRYPAATGAKEQETP